MHSSTPFAGRLSEYADYLDIPFSFAFQPIIHAGRREPVAYEALIRGVAGESAERILARIAPENRFQFDQACRIQAIQVASRIGLNSDLHLNCTADALENVSHLTEVARDAARQFGFPVENLVLEFSESEQFHHPEQFASIRTISRFFGFRVAADNFGAGDSGLRLLARFQPDQVKLNRDLTADVQHSLERQAIVHGVLATCRDLDISVVATGIETRGEYEWLRDNGVELFQGFYFAAPGFERAPEVDGKLMGS